MRIGSGAGAADTTPFGGQFDKLSLKDAPSTPRVIESKSATSVKNARAATVCPVAKLNFVPECLLLMLSTDCSHVPMPSTLVPFSPRCYWLDHARRYIISQ
jgi:hypothetical protein